MTETTPVGYYEWLDFNNPMTDETADALVADLASVDRHTSWTSAAGGPSCSSAS